MDNPDYWSVEIQLFAADDTHFGPFEKREHAMEGAKKWVRQHVSDIYREGVLAALDLHGYYDEDDLLVSVCRVQPF